MGLSDGPLALFGTVNPANGPSTLLRIMCLWNDEKELVCMISSGNWRRNLSEQLCQKDDLMSMKEYENQS